MSKEIDSPLPLPPAHEARLRAYVEQVSRPRIAAALNTDAMRQSLHGESPTAQPDPLAICAASDPRVKKVESTPSREGDGTSELQRRIAEFAAEIRRAVGEGR
jgi:hypothetical protein